MPDGNIYAIFASKNRIEGRLWDKTKWLQTEIITGRAPSADFGYSAVVLNSEVHLAFLENSTKNIYYLRRTTDGAWKELLVEGNLDIMSPPVLSADQSTTKLYCMWLQGKALQLRKIENGVWVSVAVGDLGLTFPEGLTTFYDCSKGPIGVALLDSLSQHEENYRLSYLIIKKP